MTPVLPTAEGRVTVSPYLIVAGAARAIAFYAEAFGAVELCRMGDDDPEGRIGHAELQIGESVVMLCDEAPGEGTLGPIARGGSTVGLALYVPDVDAVFDRAVAAGAMAVAPVVDQPWGDRLGVLRDPFGHDWYVATPAPAD